MTLGRLELSFYITFLLCFNMYRWSFKHTSEQGGYLVLQVPSHQVPLIYLVELL